MGAKNLAPTGIKSPDLPARRESLYRPCYPGKDKGKTGTHPLILGLGTKWR